MHTRVPIAFVTSILVGVVAVACGGDTTRVNSSSFAKHIDSLYTAMMSDPRYSHDARYTREQPLTLLELATAYGAKPRAIAVETAAGTEVWEAVEFSTADIEIQKILIAYRDPDIHTSMLVYYNPDGILLGLTLTTDDTLSVHGSASRGQSEEIVSEGGKCSPPPPLLNPDVRRTYGSSCVPSNFSSAVSADFDAIPGIGTDLRHFAIAETTLEGVHFQVVTD